MKESSECDIIDIYSLLGKKWSVPILSRFQKKPLTFNELDAIANHTINPTLLSDRLKEFIAYGVIEKKEYNGHLSYFLTPRGEELKSIMYQFKIWALKHKLHMPSVCNKETCVCEVPFLRNYKKEVVHAQASIHPS